MSKKIDAMLDFWLKAGMNVLLEGKHGFGKTERVIATFKRNNLNWKYFSASSMDPWVDFVGVPKETVGEDGGRYLELVRPKEFANDEVEALFFDEFNRAPKKVRNAVMELIQFKSINGKKFNNLKVVWAAINPHDEDETYDVEKMDPAQEDRFHVKFIVPSVPDAEYFTARYGKDVSTVALEWWKAIPKEIEKPSGRRLQYILDCWQMGGDIGYLTSKGTNPGKLVMGLASGSVVELLKAILETGDIEALRGFMRKENNYAVAVDYLKSNPGYIGKIIPAIDEERLMRLTVEMPMVMNWVTSDAHAADFADMLRATLNAGTLSKDEEKRIRTILSRKVTATTQGGATSYQPATLEVGDTTYNDTVAALADDVVQGDHGERVDAYNWLELNMLNHSRLEISIAVLFILFRIIETEKEEDVITQFPLLMPMMNFCLADCVKQGVTFNDSAVKGYFLDGKYKITKRVRVQGFIDANVNQLTDLRNKPRIM